jgi:hypothetical protein
MAATLREINEWKSRGIEKGAKYIISVCDTFNYEDYPIFVMPEENLNKEKSKYDGTNMQKINEIITL